MTEELKRRFNGVENALLVNVVGMDVNTSNRLRKELDAKKINVLVVKNSIAGRAAAGTSLASLFEGLNGNSAVCWGSQDIVSLAKEIVQVSKDKTYDKFEIRGGVMDGEAFAADKVVDISKWPSREEQIALLLGQIVGVGSKLSAQLLSGGALLASQIKKIAGDDEEENKEESAE